MSFEITNPKERISSVKNIDEAFDLIKEQFSDKDKIAMRCVYATTKDTPVDLSYTHEAGSGILRDEEDETIKFIVKPIVEIVQDGTEFDLDASKRLSVETRVINLSAPFNKNDFTGGIAVGFQQDIDVWIMHADKPPAGIKSSDIKKVILIYDQTKLHKGADRYAGGNGTGNVYFFPEDAKDIILEAIIIED